MRALLTLFGSVVLFGTLCGCAQVMAIRQQPPLDRGAVQAGVDRSMIIGVIGSPLGSDENDDGTLVEVYKFADGGRKNAFGSKAARVVLYTAGDVFTLFLSQVVWMPMELAFEPTTYTADVVYAKNDDGRWIAQSVREINAHNQEVTRNSVAVP